MSAPRVLLAGLFHETNTFADDITGLGGFDQRRDGELLACAGDGSPLGAIVELAGRLGWELVPTVDYRAVPSGPVDDRVVAQFRSEFEERARVALRRGIDAVYWVLHGAMVSQSCLDVEGEILEAFRRLPGAANVPVFGVLDLHANVSAKMAAHSEGLVTYRENPHRDAAESAVRAGELLDRSLKAGRIPRTWFRQLPLLWPPSGTATADLPMAALAEAARRGEGIGHAVVNVFAGFAHADTPETGVSISVVTDLPGAAALAVLDDLEAIARRHHAAGYPVEAELDDAVAAAMHGGTRPGPVVLVEPADNIGGGGPGDCTSVLRALVRARVSSAGVILNDPDAVRALGDVAPGGRLRLALGGKGSRLDPGPLSLEVELHRRSDGVFELEDRQSHLASMGRTRIEMGPCAVVRHGGITILLTSRKTPPMDLGQWRSQGVDPAALGIVVAKAAVAHRRSYDPIAGGSFTVRTPGPCSSALRALPYRYLRRPIVPFDPLPTVS